MTSYLDEKGLLDSSQYGFRRGKSTVTNILECDARKGELINSGKACDLVNIDFRRAFDLVYHAILCKKLKDMGVNRCYLSWVKDYLSDWKQSVAYGGVCSNLADVPSGVVQGNCVGPFFFTLFINDMCKVLRHARSSLFADDLKMIGDISTTECQELMQADVLAVVDWSAANKLPTNLDKSVVLHYGRTNVRTQYKLNGQKLTAAETCNDLGLLRSHNFSYEERARNVALKSARLSGMVLKVFSTREPNFLRQLFVSYNRPTLEYASQAWAPSSVSVCNIIERVQHRFIKRIKGYGSFTYEQRLAQLNLDTLSYRRLYHDILLVYKSLNGNMNITPSSLGLELSHISSRKGGFRLNHLKPKSEAMAANFCFRPVSPPPMRMGQPPRQLY